MPPAPVVLRTAYRFRTLGALTLASLALWLHSFQDFAVFRSILTDGTPAPRADQVTFTGRWPVQDGQRAALILRIANERPGPAAFDIQFDDSTVCRAIVPGHRTRRIDCQATPAHVADHRLSVSSVAASTDWLLSYAEVASHHGNSAGPLRLYITPPDSTFTRAPFLSWLGVTFLLIAPWLIAPRPAGRARVAEIAVLSVLACFLIAVVILRLGHAYSIILSIGTAARLAVVSSLFRLNHVRRLLGSAGPHSTRERCFLVLLVGALATAVVAVVPSIELSQDYGGNWTGFIKFDRTFVAMNPLVTSRPGLVDTLLTYPSGYDGQFMFLEAMDPLLLMFRDQPARYAEVVGANPAYRFGRIGFSWLVAILSAGAPDRFARTIVLLALGAVGACAGALAWMALHHGRAPAWGLLVLLVPGFWVSVRTGLPEPAAAAFWLLSIVLWRRSWVVSGLLIGLSLLTRETGVVVLGWLVFIAGGARRAAALSVIALAPVVAWRAYVAIVLWPAFGASSLLYHPPSAIPLAGIVDTFMLISSGQYWPAVPQMTVSAISLAFLLTFALAMAVASLGQLTADNAWPLVAAVYAVNALTLDSSSVWSHVLNAERTTYELFVALAILTLANPHSGRLRHAMHGFWCATAVYMAVATLDAVHIRESFVAAFWES